MEASSKKTALSGLARKLVQDGLVDEATALSALEQCRIAKTTFVHYLTEKKLVNEKILAESSAKNFGLPLFNLDVIEVDSIPKSVVKTELIKRHQALPIYRRGDNLYIAVADPTNQIAFDEIKFHTGLMIHGVLVYESQLSKLITALLSEQEAAVFKDLEDTHLEDIDLEKEDEEKSGNVVIEADDAPIIRFVHKILLDAINKGASDIHFEPYEKNFRIRMRVDGLLQELANPPLVLASRIAARIKVMSRLDISERRVPQDGRFKINISSSRAMDFRVSTCPTVNGEKVVIRILDPTAAHIGIDALGFEPDQKEKYLKALNKPQGLILVTGPTGSGKTVTLYTGLNIVNTPDVNISTVEDPVEIHVPGINQVNINLKAGLTFSSVLRSFLRQDPDIIMVGEMRDLETAEIGVKAAQTGHLVLSTLHTNSATETLTRLSNMGLPAYNVATSVTLIIAQRLGRRLCEHCKVQEKIPEKILLESGFKADEVSGITVYNAGKGCENCTLGYKGRVGFYELLVMTETLSDAILRGKNALEFLKIAQDEGMITLRRAGLNKVKMGLTSLEEVNRVTQD